MIALSYLLSSVDADVVVGNSAAFEFSVSVHQYNNVV